MGENRPVEAARESEKLRAFTRSLLRDLRALERMLAEGVFETGATRVGAEQEVFLVDGAGRPAPMALRVLEALADPHFTTEVALFNLELNLDPLPIGGKCLSRMEAQLRGLLLRAREAAGHLGCDLVLTGILPTVRKSDLGLENMTPIPRYRALNDAMARLRGSDWEIRLKGTDEIHLRHESVMVESCNASFQVHLQVDPADFARLYNLAQVVAAPVLAAACNSPLLFGRRLWRETRIALFQQSVDTRTSGTGHREAQPRVDFGRGWVRESVLELFQAGISRHRVLIACEPEEDPFERLERGEVPELRALRLHNGTIYPWNRACYGVLGGRPHLRIENRVLPSGPTPLDEVANAALWYGLMAAVDAAVGDVTRRIPFDDAKQNFIAAARNGLGAEFAWLDGESLPAPRLLLEHLLPAAREGLALRGVDAGDADRYLGVVEERVRTGITGAAWLLRSFADLQGRGTDSERLHALTAATVARQWDGTPVARWAPARIEEGGGWKRNYLKVEQYMATDFPTVHEGDPLDLAANLMLWERVRHLPVEDEAHRLVGLVSYRALLRVLARGKQERRTGTIAVSEVMRRDPLVVAPETPTLRAVEILRGGGVGCLPVVKDGRLVGMVTEGTLMEIAGRLLEQHLKE